MADKVTYAWLRWAGGVHRFELRFPNHPGMAGTMHRVNDLAARFQRLHSGQWSAFDISDTIEAGLIDGHFRRAEAHRAHELVRDHVVSRPMVESLPLAQTVLAVAMFGAPLTTEADAGSPADLTGGDDE